MRKSDGSNKNKIVEALCLPKDICMGDVKLTMYGCHEALIENYKGIIQYDDSFILLQCKKIQILIEGQKLKIDYYTNTDMKISGMFTAIKYM